MVDLMSLNPNLNEGGAVANNSTAAMMAKAMPVPPSTLRV